MIIIKNHDEMEKIKKVGLKLGKVFDELSELIKPGLSTLQISEYCEKLLAKEGCKPTFKGYDGFSGAVCTSRNETLIHGIPSKHEILQEGDIISIDMGNVDETGFQGDACRTFPVGNISAEAKELIRCSEECFYEAYKKLKPGIHLAEISKAIQRVADKYGFSLVREYGGHGLGQDMHEDPFIYNYYSPINGQGPILREGMCLAIEPMVMMGKPDIVILDDGWTVQSKDGLLTSHYENDVLITSEGAIITSIDNNVKQHLEKLERQE